MLHLLKRSQNLFPLLWFLLIPFPLSASSDNITILPAPHYSASTTVDVVNAKETLRILAVMAEFQPEDNRFTTGNGTFNLPFFDRDDIVIDPPPHNRDSMGWKAHFEAHLEFAKNYFQTVSNGKMEIEYHVLPRLIQLDQPMQAYAPLGQTQDENFKLAHLARDAWSKVKKKDIPGDFSENTKGNTLFIVFHAGSGRNIELTGTSLDKTPQDIPSVFLNTQSLQRLLEKPDFDGFEIENAGFRVSNTAILPQTQSRTGEDITGQEYLLQLSINGLLAANIGSFLGLPDLFNTKTGASGIGRFGLMDGASIFSYLGLFPPEPSAWERIHLGWADPFDIALDTDSPIPLPAISKRNGPASTNAIARHRISSDEYFLVENRHRNPSAEPLEITMRTAYGNDIRYTIDPDDKRFDPLNSSEYHELFDTTGVIINVSNFDWSLPGGPTRVDNDSIRILNGGMLIWHIDEAVIRSTLSQNRVNADSERRGVHLVEADGANDIGRPPGPQQNRFTNGHAFDFWWKYNDFKVITARGDTIITYQENGNRFGPDTQPSNHSHTGSLSFFEFYDFSDNLPEANFYARSLSNYAQYAQPASPALPLLPPDSIGYPASSPYPVSPKKIALPDEKHHLLLPSPKGFYLIDPKNPDDGYHFLEHHHPSSPLVINNQLIAGQIGVENDTQTLRSWRFDNDQWGIVWKKEGVPGSPGFLSLENPQTITVDHTAFRLSIDGDRLDDAPDARQQSGETDGITALLYENRLELSDGSFHYDLSSEEKRSKRKYAGNLRFSGDSGPSIFLLTDQRLTLFEQNKNNEWKSRIIYQGGPLSWPAFGDFTGGGSLDILITDYEENKIYAFNRDGGLLDFFPLSPPLGALFSGTPYLADITGNGRMELLTAASDGLSHSVFAYAGSLDLLEGFPLLIGGINEASLYTSPPMLIDEDYLYAASSQGEIRSWYLPLLEETGWGKIYGPQSGNKAGLNMEKDRVERPEFGLLNDLETYNWPNPADDHTYIRYETSAPASIDITVITPGGLTIFQKQTHSEGRHPQEVRLNTTSWGNGVYFARIRARSNETTEHKLIKIVITH